MQNKLKDIIRDRFTSFVFFYKTLKYRIYITILLGITIAVLDSFGLAMFLPLLQLVGGDETASSQGMGNLQFIVEGFENMGLSMDIVTVLGILCVFFTIKGIATYFAGVYKVYITQYFLRNIRLKLVHGLNDLNYKRFVSWDFGRIQNTLTTEVERITNGFVHYFKTINHFIMVLVYVGFAVAVDARFAILVTLGGALSHILYHYVFNLSRKASREFSKDSNRYQGLVLQHIGNYKYLKATGQLETFSDQIDDSIYKLERNNRKLGIYGAFMGATREPILLGVISIVILIQTKVMGAPLAPILISLLFFYRALTSLNQLQSSWNLFLKFSGSVENVIDFEEQLYSGKSKVKNQSEEPVPFNDYIELKDVNFSYGDEQILKNVNLKINKNESIGIVGESGSGKTTLVSLISALMEPNEGCLNVDGKEIRQYNKKEYQKKIGFVSQDPIVFADSLYNNVTFWSEKTDDNLERFWIALEQASIAEFVTQLSGKEDEQLGNNGINLSGGQKQRLSIARELFRDPEILIMDEATSSLDGETEKNIQENIEALKGSCTLIVIAHRLVTIKNLDRIVLMDNGQIRNNESFSDLINKDSKFKDMVELQEI